jgi:hypothetical protein
MPEIGQIHTDDGKLADASTVLSDAASNGIKIPGGKMAFALITKTKQGKKLNFQKIKIDSDSQLV